MSILDQFSLAGKVALVTGARRGLGQAIAAGLAEAGADIAALDRSPDDSETRARIEGTGRRYMQITLDLAVAGPDEIDNVIGQITSSLGRLDILVNNAGIIRRNDLMDFTESDWDDVLQVNLKAAFFLARSAARVMTQQQRGKIINIASMLSYQGGIRVPSYTASKHGISGLTLAMCNELAPLGINVNAIAPGYMATDNTAPLRADPARNQAILERIPAGHWGAPEDLQGAAVFLASAASDYLHGTIMPVDGGWLAR
jgi:2-deoxy-D-gluconate 3-dehydrogenase